MTSASIRNSVQFSAERTHTIRALSKPCQASHPEQVTTLGWAAVYSTVVQFCITYVSWFAALARLPASVAAIGTMAVPVIGVVASALALHEPLGPGQIAALVFTLAAVVLATR
jgi:drug/metabolite transporter (DMT)-like permease